MPQRWCPNPCRSRPRTATGSVGAELASELAWGAAISQERRTRQTMMLAREKGPHDAVAKLEVRKEAPDEEGALAKELALDVVRSTVRYPEENRANPRRPVVSVE